MKIYTAKYMKLITVMYDPYDNGYSYSNFLFKRGEIISNIVDLVKRGVSCKKLNEACMPLLYNEHHLNVARQLDLKGSDDDVIECPLETNDDETACADSVIWMKDFEINAGFDVDMIVPEIDHAREYLFYAGWGWADKPVDVILESVENGTWHSLRRPEILYAATSAVQEFHLDGRKNMKDVSKLIDNLRLLHRLVYFGDMADCANDIARRCKIPFDEFLTSKTVAELSALKMTKVVPFKPVLPDAIKTDLD